MPSTKFKKGDIVSITWMEAPNLGIIAHGDTSLGEQVFLGMNWISSPSPRYFYHHRGPVCDIWVKPSDLKKITHAEGLDDDQ